MSGAQLMHALERLRRGPALGGAITLLPPACARPLDEWQRHIRRRLGWGVRYLELRDDLFPDPLLESLAAHIPPERRLLSARRQRSPAELVALGRLARGAARLDWPLELGPCPAALAGQRVASLHARAPGETLAAATERLVAGGAGARLLKLAVPVHTLRELAFGHAWAAAEPGRRVFLPSSPAGPSSGPSSGAGRWAWYRLWRGDGQALNFVRERAGHGTAPSPDQPSLLEWLERRDFATSQAGGPEFAAILGDPVAHSLTPREQGPFFRARGWPVLRIRLLAEDLQSCDAFTELKRLGLRAAAVTAPWKREARRWLAEHGGDFTGDSDSCNTLGVTADGRLHGTSTDGEGLAAAWSEARSRCAVAEDAEVALWGGGGTLSLLRGAFPRARAYAARTGLPRDGESAKGASPAAVIWAVGRSRQPGCTWPPSTWRPQLVLDLNYADDSPGREYAARAGAHYVSGLTFFRAQAAAQRRFWSGLGL